PADLQLVWMPALVVLAVVTVLLDVALWRSRRHSAQLQIDLHDAELALAREQAAQQERDRAHAATKEERGLSGGRLKTEFASLAARMLQERELHLRASSQEALSALLQPLREQLHAFQQPANQLPVKARRRTVSLSTAIRRPSEVG